MVPADTLGKEHDVYDETTRTATNEKPRQQMTLSRSAFLAKGIALAAPLLLAACGGRVAAGGLLGFWQADASGNYDNRGYTLRGHQFADDAGQYHLETVVPGLYPGRTRHIHVKVQAPNGPVLTTQLYFAGEARNASDSIFNSK